jgi:hypothetical protein
LLVECSVPAGLVNVKKSQQKCLFFFTNTNMMAGTTGSENRDEENLRSAGSSYLMMRQSDPIYPDRELFEGSGSFSD